MKRCKYCDKYSELEDGRFMCSGDSRELPVECLFRNFLWSRNDSRNTLKKAERMIDRLDKEMDEGEEWKK